MNALDLRNRMTQNAKAYNKHLTDDYAGTLSLQSLARITHPIDRVGFQNEIDKLIESYKSK